MRGHTVFKFGGQLPATQMDVAERRLNVAVTGKAGDFVNIPIGARQVSQAEVTRGVSRELSHAGSRGNLSHYLGPGPD